jgi:hypothetical protein
MRFCARANHDELHQLPRENSNSAHEDQDQQNYDDETQATAAVIAGTVEWRAANAADAAEKNQNQNNEDDCPNRHKVVPSILPICAAHQYAFRNALRYPYALLMQLFVTPPLPISDAGSVP